MEICENVAAVVYSSFCGIIVSSFYYIFLPSKAYRTSSAHRRKERVMLILMFAFTTSSVVSLMNSFWDLYKVLLPRTELICDRPLRRMPPVGVGCVSITFLLSLFLMW